MAWISSFAGMGVMAAVALSYAWLPTAPAFPASASPIVPPPGQCDRLGALADGRTDVAPAFQACIDAAAPGATIALAPGRYLLAGALVLGRPITITTRALSARAPGCTPTGTRCATLLVRPGAIPDGAMPITVQSAGVAFDHVVILGGANPAACLNPQTRPSAGGLRVSGDGFRLTGSVLKGFACYSSLEYRSGADGVISGNIFQGNGTHTTKAMWSDGLTVHEARRLKATDNRFIDNTDVQFILGGCAECDVSGNLFRHSGSAAGGSFAELMIQAWPRNTSGRYDGSTFARNDIDCGAMKRCGFGILIGSNPWYDAPVSGGTVANNRVANAMLGLDVEDLNGAVSLGSNQVSGATGQYPASCGSIAIASPVNVAAGARTFVRGDIPGDATARTLRGCILNWWSR